MSVTAKTPGALILNGGDEFNPGNEPQDRILVEAADRGPALVVPTAAARGGPQQAVANAKRWFGQLGLEMESLPILTRTSARSPELVELARAAGSFYLVGGDPGLLLGILAGSPVWEGMLSAWRTGAVLAGSSAGAMALCQWSLIRSGWPDRTQRRFRDALSLIPNTVVLPHYETFGHRWASSAREAAPSPSTILLGLDERTAAVWIDGSWRCLGAGRVTVDAGRGLVVCESEGPIPDLPQPTQVRCESI